MFGLKFLKSSSPLAKNLMRVVLSIYLILAIFLTSLQMYMEYRNEEQRLTRRINHMIATFAPIFSQAMWDINDKQLQATMLGLLESNEIIGISLTDIDNISTEKGIFEQEGEVFYRPEGEPLDPHQTNELTSKHHLNLLRFPFEVSFTRPDGSTKTIGKGVLYSSRSIILDRVSYTLLITLISATIKTLFLWLIFLIIVKRMVSNPLEKLSELMLDYDPSTASCKYGVK